MSTIDDVTIAIKTFERPHRLNKLIKSIRKFYPTIKIMVADDSKKPYIRNDVDYHVLKYDRGLSAGRNYMVDRVTTKYILILDDDWIFVKKTNIQNMIDILENNDIDILAGDWSNIQPTMCAIFVPHDDPTVIEIKSIPVKEDCDFTYCDFTHNFLLAEPKTFQLIGGWDDELKVLEHVDFALRVKEHNLKLALTTKVAIHFTQTLIEGSDSMEYKRLRRRKHFAALSMKKRGIKKLINFTGRTKYYN